MSTHRYLFLFAGLAAALTASANPKITPAVQQAIENDPRGSTAVIIYLNNQPSYAIGRQVDALYRPTIKNLGVRLREIAKGNRLPGAIPPSLERRMAPNLTPMEEQERREIVQRIDELHAAQVNETVRRINMVVASDLAATDTFVRSRRGVVTGFATILTVLFAEIPNSEIARVAAYPRIAFIDFDHEGAPELDNHKHSLGLVTGFWANSYTGGIHDVGVLDTGVQQSHTALNTHPFESNAGTTDNDGHGTGMAGILASTHATYTGMAFGCHTICVSRAGNESTSMSGLNYLVTGTIEKPENINYSFGNGRANDTDYSLFDAFFDGAIDTFNIMVSKSTGNGGFGTTTITHPAPAFNLLASANMDDLNSQNRNTHVITSSSSRGPTLNGRKKPDITAPGTNSMSTNRTGGFSNIGGTSSASPHTGGGIVLIREHGATTTYGAKAVILNSAQAWADNNTQTTADDGPVPGSQWNKTFGWGYLDLGKAYQNAPDLFEEEMPTPNGQRKFHFFKGTMFANEKATLVWNRHVVFNGTSNPTQIRSLSNLELGAYNETTNVLMSSSTSAIDNVEQLHVSAQAPVVLKVYTNGNFDPAVTTQPYGLATEEDFVMATGPSFAMVPDLPATAAPGSIVEVSVDVTNTGDLVAHNVNVSISGASVSSGANPQVIPSIGVGQSVEVTWQIQAQGSPGAQQLTFQATSTSYGENFAGTVQANLTVGGANTSPNSLTVLRGMVFSGGLANVLTSDNNYLVVRPGIVLAPSQSPVYIELGGVSPTATPTALTFIVESSGSSTSLQQQLELFNRVTMEWDVAGTANLALTDNTYAANAPSAASNYVQPGTLAIRARIAVMPFAPIISLPWSYRLDMAGWSIQ